MFSLSLQRIFFMSCIGILFIHIHIQIIAIDKALKPFSISHIYIYINTASYIRFDKFCKKVDIHVSLPQIKINDKCNNTRNIFIC